MHYEIPPDKPKTTHSISKVTRKPESTGSSNQEASSSKKNIVDNVQISTNSTEATRKLREIIHGKSKMRNIEIRDRFQELDRSKRDLEGRIKEKRRVIETLKKKETKEGRAAQ